MSKRLVSILIPAYNAEAWIHQAIQSAMEQTWSRKEIIVVDDGSKDGTREAIRAHESPNLKFVGQENQGAARARNRALSLAQGDFIQWLDADDLLAPEKIALQMAVAETVSPRTLLSSSFGKFYLSSARASFQPGPLWRDLSPAEWMTEKFLNNTWMNPAVWLVTRELTDLAGEWNPELSLDDDGEYFCRVVAASEFVRFVPEAQSFYRQWNPRSLSRSANRKALCSLLKSLELSVGYLLSLENSERTRAAARSYLQVWFDYFYPNETDLLDEMRRLARNLCGGEMHAPSLSLKYSLIRHVFGWGAARKVARMTAAAKLATSLQLDRVRSSWD